MCCRDTLHRQRGAVLVELMTGLVIGLMVTLAALSLLAVLHASASLQAEATLLQQSIDVALHTIGQQVRQAGAIDLQATPDGSAVQFSRAFTGHGSTGLPIQGQDGARGGADMLWTSHQDGPQAYDCLGNQAPPAQAGIRVDSQFLVTAGSLRCLGTHASVGSQVIADRVEDLQIRYGLHADGPGGPTLRFVDASAVGTQWSAVHAVHVCLQIAGERRLHLPPATELRSCHGAALPSDGRLRRVVQATFTLRNAAP